MPAGTEVKTVAIYDEPFWRDDGISGASVATDDTIEITLDTTQPGHAHGVIGTYAAGPRARALWAMEERDRRTELLSMLTTRLGTACRHATGGARGQLGGGALDPRVLHGPFPDGGPDPVRPPPSRARRSRALGRAPRRPR